MEVDDGFLRQILPTSAENRVTQFVASTLTCSTSTCSILQKSTGKKRRKQKQTLVNYVDVTSNEEVDSLHDDLAKFIFACNVPFNIVETIYFKNFIKRLRSAYAEKLPSRKMLSIALLDRVYDKYVNNSKNKLYEDSVTMLHCADGT